MNPKNWFAVIVFLLLVIVAVLVWPQLPWKKVTGGSTDNLAALPFYYGSGQRKPDAPVYRPGIDKPPSFCDALSRVCNNAVQEDFNDCANSCLDDEADRDEARNCPLMGAVAVGTGGQGCTLFSPEYKDCMNNCKVDKKNGQDMCKAIKQECVDRGGDDIPWPDDDNDWNEGRTTDVYPPPLPEVIT